MAESRETEAHGDADVPAQRRHPKRGDTRRGYESGMPKGRMSFTEYRAWATTKEGQRVLANYPQPHQHTDQEERQRKEEFEKYLKGH